MTKFKGQFIREKTVQLIRQFFLDRQFHEIDVPLLLPRIPLEPNLYPLKTCWQEKNQTFYLITSPESSLKKLIANGLGNCFSIAKVWRDLENIGPAHNLEFSMLEWYEMGKDYHHIAQTTQNLILDCYHGIQKYLGNRTTNILTYQGHQIDLTPPWHQYTLKQLFLEFAHMDLSSNLTPSSIIRTAKKKGYNTQGITTWEPLFTQIFINEVETHLPTDKPVIIFDYPTQSSPLCQPCPDSPGFSQRFEFYIAGLEIGNAYTELNVTKTLKDNFKAEDLFRQKHHLPNHPPDYDFAKKCGSLPECSGIGLGVDRLSMLFTGTSRIEDVLFFPTSHLTSDGI